MGQVDEAAQIAEVILRVAATYPDISTADVTRVVQTMHTGFDDAKVREFIPLLVERKVRTVLGPPLDLPQLDDLARERYLFVREPAGERVDHLHELPTLDSAVSQFTLH